MQSKRLRALIDLLDDPDNLVFETVERELLNENHKIIPVLEDKWGDSFDEFFQSRIENLINDLHFKQTKKRLKRWILSSENDLLEGFICIDRFQYPDLNLLSINHKIERITTSVWLEFSNSLTLLEKTTILNHFLFDIYRFSINRRNIFSPQNCYLSQLLMTKEGNPFSLAIFYTIIARKLGLPASIIDFPKNPLIALVDSDIAKKAHNNFNNSDVLFYINPSNKGSITNRREIDYYLKKNKYNPTDRYAEPASDKLIICRLLESLKATSRAAGFIEKAGRTEEMLELFRDD